MRIKEQWVQGLISDCVATSKGFRLHYTDDCGLHYKNEEGDVSLLELLFSTQLVALTLSPRLVRILNTKVCVHHLELVSDVLEPVS